jgi:phage shock protein E
VAKTNVASAITEAEAADLISRGACILDVRTRVATWTGIVPGARRVSLARLWRCIHELPSDRTILIYCTTGRRAERAKLVLEDVGFHAVNGGRFKTIAKIVEAQREAADMPRDAAASTAWFQSEGQWS